MERKTRMWSGLVMVWLAACAPAADLEPVPPEFTSADAAAVRGIEEAYRTGWMANDSDAVMAVLTDDAVLLPAGLGPITGHDAIRDYWWPDDGSRTTIHEYSIDIAEVNGSGDLAFLRGRGTLGFTYVGPDGEASELSSEAVHLAVYRRGEDGTWRMARRAWSRIQ